MINDASNIYDCDYFVHLIKNMLSNERFIHSINVSHVSESLAKHYGENPKKAKVAGLLHDICKELPDEKNQKLILDLNIDFEYPKKVLHGPAASVYIKNELNIIDDDIINAVKYHTTGRKDMSPLEKIVFVADYISPERKWDNLTTVKELAYQNLDKAVLQKLSKAIYGCIEKKRTISLDTVEAYNQLVNR